MLAAIIILTIAGVYPQRKRRLSQLSPLPMFTCARLGLTAHYHQAPSDQKPN